MGWTTLHRTPGTPLAEFFKGQFDFDKTDEGRSGKVLACSASRTVAYLAYEVVNPEETRVIAIICLIKFCPHDYNENFGYKDMDESAGPNEANCPEKILNMLTPLKEDEVYAKAWRDSCRENIREKKQLSVDLKRALKNHLAIKLEHALHFRGFGNNPYDTFFVDKLKPLIFRTERGSRVRIGRGKLISNTYKLVDLS